MDGIRPIYSKFESGLKSGSAEIYKYEIPGGQYSNLRPQVESFGLGHRFKEVKLMYKRVNEMVGDIIKVTPSSKMVGDMAIFMVQNDLTPENVYNKAKNMAFPDSVVSYFKGMMGQPEGGFPKDLQKLVLKGEKPIDVRPGELLKDEDFQGIKGHINKRFSIKATNRDAISYALYPDVYEEYLKFLQEFGNVSRIRSDVFLHGLAEGEVSEIDLGEGKTIIVKLVQIGNIDLDGYRNVDFEINGYRRSIRIKDRTQTVRSVLGEDSKFRMADSNNKSDVGASIPGNIIKILVKKGERVEEGQSLAVIEAMKMETNIVATIEGIIEAVYVSEGQQVKTGELLMKISN